MPRHGLYLVDGGDDAADDADLSEVAFIGGVGWIVGFNDKGYWFALAVVGEVQTLADGSHAIPQYKQAGRGRDALLVIDEELAAGVERWLHGIAHHADDGQGCFGGIGDVVEVSLREAPFPYGVLMIDKGAAAGACLHIIFDDSGGIVLGFRRWRCAFTEKDPLGRNAQEMPIFFRHFFGYGARSGFVRRVGWLGYVMDFRKLSGGFISRRAGLA